MDPYRLSIFANIADRYDLLNDCLSLGTHRLWKRRLVRTLLARSQGPVLDVATGSGDVAARFAKRLPTVGLDPCARMLGVARRRYPHLNWVEGSSERLPFDDESMGTLACAFGVRNFSDRPRAFREWRRVLKPGGWGAILEIHPIAPGPLAWLMRPLWQRGMPWLGGKIASRGAYEYLRDSSSGFVPAEHLVGELETAGFSPLKPTFLLPSRMVSLIVFR